METELNTLITNLEAVDSTNAPLWAITLIDSMKGLFNILINFKELAKKVELLESVNAVTEQTTNVLKQENVKLGDKVSKLELRIDDQEQRSRNNCLLIHGIEEANIQEVTDVVAIDVFNRALGFELGTDVIARSHRLGPKKDARATRANKPNPRPIIVRFNSYRTRKEVFTCKKKLKGTNISITENLTQRRFSLYKQAIAQLRKGNCWTNDGRIFTKVNDKLLIINSADDLIVN